MMLNAAEKRQPRSDFSHRLVGRVVTYSTFPMAESEAVAS
jgi:hypothetical protein